MTDAGESLPHKDDSFHLLDFLSLTSVDHLSGRCAVITRRHNGLRCRRFVKLSQAMAVSRGACHPFMAHILFHNNVRKNFTRQADEFGSGERFSQLVLGLHGDHCIQVLCRWRNMISINTACSVPASVGELALALALAAGNVFIQL